MTSDTNFVVLEKFKGYAIIRLNRPERKNGIISEMQLKMKESLYSLAEEESIKFVVLTGTGEYFTSGADFINTTQELNRTEKMVRENLQYFKSLVDALIKFPKPIIAAVNGPAIGMGVTILPLCDLVYASDNSTFLTPFTSLGVTPEGCSSYTFPKIMGYAKASEVLLFNRTLTAKEACQAGLVTQIFPRQLFWNEVQKRISEFVDHPIMCYIHGKELIRGPEREKLLAINHNETEVLVERYQSDDLIMQAIKFIEKRRKIKEQRKAKL